MLCFVVVVVADGQVGRGGEFRWVFSHARIVHVGAPHVVHVGAPRVL